MVTLRDFLELLFPSLNGQFIEARLIKPGHVLPIFYESVEQLLNAMPEDVAGQNGFNVYFGVCPRIRKEGTKDAIKVVPCLWADLDGKDFPGGKPEALKRLQEFAFPPTTIVDSAHGYHAYWLLKEPEEIARPGDVARIEAHLKALASALGADQSAAELARILRVPGTFNLKDPSAPVPVTIVCFEPGRQYNLGDFDFLVSSESPEQTQKANPPGWIAQALAELKPGSRNSTFARIAGRLRRDGWEAADILALLTPLAERSGFPLAELRQEIEGLCRRYPSGNPSPSSPINSQGTETESKPLEALPLASFFAQVAAHITWSIEGVLPKEGAGIVAGPAGYGKSWMLLDVAIEHARGGKWLGQFATAQGRVLYLDEESSPALLRHRLTRLLAAKGLSADQLDLHVAVGQGLSFSNPASVEQLRRLLDQLRPALVIVDSLIRVHRAEENSASEMAQVFKAVKALIREFGCAFLFADHQRKPGGFGVSLDLLLRGSSEKAAFVDTLLSLQRKEGTLIVEHSKSRYAEPIPAFVVRIEDTGPEATAVVYGGEAEQIKQAARQEAAREFLTAALGTGDWIARKDLVEQAKEAEVSEKALDEVLKALEGEGSVERENRKPDSGRGGKAAFYHRKPDIASPSPDQETETETESLEV